MIFPSNEKSREQRKNKQRGKKSKECKPKESQIKMCGGTQLFKEKNFILRGEKKNCGLRTIEALPFTLFLPLLLTF